MKEIIREEDIERVVMSDGSAMCVYTKMEDDTKYAASYSYQNIEESKTYCPLCGTIYDKENSKCPACNGIGLDIISYKDMPTLIMSMINDHVKISIVLKGDAKLHTFFIPESTSIL